MVEPALNLTGAVDSADPLLFRHVHAAGHWVGARQVFIDNQLLRGQAGFEVLAPLRIAGSDESVLVNRGWVARSPDYPKPPPVAAPEGDAEVTGLATLPPARFLELSSEVISGNVFQNLSIERYRGWSGLPMLPVVILADRPGPGLASLEARPDTNPSMHRQYEAQWFLMAATAVALWVGLNLKRVR
jgi:surfeit locus 1 family protein